MNDLSTSASITINAFAEEVWKAMTTPELIKQWFFGVDTVTDWKVGGPLVHKGEYQGKPYEDKGEVLRFEPPRLLISARREREQHVDVLWLLGERLWQGFGWSEPA